MRLCVSRSRKGRTRLGYERGARGLQSFHDRGSATKLYCTSDSENQLKPARLFSFMDENLQPRHGRILLSRGIFAPLSFTCQHIKTGRAPRVNVTSSPFIENLNTTNDYAAPSRLF